MGASGFAENLFSPTRLIGRSWIAAGLKSDGSVFQPRFASMALMPRASGVSSRMRSMSHMSKCTAYVARTEQANDGSLRLTPLRVSLARGQDVAVERGGSPSE